MRGMGCALYIRCALSIHQKECRRSLGCALYVHRCALSTGKYGTLAHTIKMNIFNFNGLEASQRDSKQVERIDGTDD
jgi:hypothetical protein